MASTLRQSTPTVAGLEIPATRSVTPRQSSFAGHSTVRPCSTPKGWNQRHGRDAARALDRSGPRIRPARHRQGGGIRASDAPGRSGARPRGATGHTGGDQPVVHRLGRNSELDRQCRIGWLSSTYAVTSVATSTARGITPSFHAPRRPERAGRARPRLPSRTSPVRARPTATSFDRNFPNGFGLTAATDRRLHLTPITEISAVVPAQTRCQSEREAVRNPSALHTLLTLTADRLTRPRSFYRSPAIIPPRTAAAARSLAGMA
jgi:hypothetical protein